MQASACLPEIHSLALRARKISLLESVAETIRELALESRWDTASTSASQYSGRAVPLVRWFGIGDVEVADPLEDRIFDEGSHGLGVRDVVRRCGESCRLVTLSGVAARIDRSLGG